MKKLLVLLSLMFSLNGFAETINYENCTESDLAKLAESNLKGISTMRLMLADDIIPAITTCKVLKPRLYYAQVCGMTITEMDYYKIATDKDVKFEIATNFTYKSCARRRYFRYIDSFKMTRE